MTQSTKEDPPVFLPSGPSQYFPLNVSSPIDSLALSTRLLQPMLPALITVLQHEDEGYWRCLFWPLQHIQAITFVVRGKTLAN